MRSNTVEVHAATRRIATRAFFASPRPGSMQAHYEVTRLAFRPGGVPAALPAIERAFTSGETRGRLLAVLTSDIGTLNEVLIVQSLDVASAPRSSELSSVGDQLVEVNSSRFASFPFV